MDRSVFVNAILHPKAPPPEGLSAPAGALVVNRFAVYRNNVIAGLINALSDGFPVVRKLVGERFFRAMGAEFVRGHPPASAVMVWYGAEFANFLRGFPPVQHLPYLPDVARLEYCRRLSFHAADAPAYGADVFQGIPETDLGATCIRLHPSVHIVRSPYPVRSIWLRNAVSDDLPIPASAEDTLIVRPLSQPDSGVEIHRLPIGGALFLSALASGQTLDSAALHGQSEEGFDLPEVLGVAFAARAFAGVAPQQTALPQVLPAQDLPARDLPDQADAFLHRRDAS